VDGEITEMIQAQEISGQSGAQEAETNPGSEPQ
jgi:hypothetical protein